MKRIPPVINLLLLLSSVVVFAQREVVSLSNNWQFTLQDQTDFSKPALDTSDWNTITVPHDWAFENGITKEGAQGASGGYFGGGVGWYRKTIEVPARWKNKQINLEFDGVYMNSEVWINGIAVGKRPYGYISFRYEISKHLKTGANTIAVRVDNSKENSARWYHPCGIYAPARIITTEKVHIQPHGVYITTPKIDQDNAIIAIETSIKKALNNASGLTKKAKLETLILDQNGKTVGNHTQVFELKKTQDWQLNEQLSVPKPHLWSPDTPYLYTAISRIKVKNKIIDEVKTRFGIRSIDWKTDSGFWLNGKNIKLLGVSEHYEGGPVGGAWTKSLMRWKLGLLKEMGVNAIRTAHNPAPPLFYELCDEMGIMVMDEIFDGWKKKAKEDYGKQAFADWWKRDMTEWLLRDRNHPSIIIYSVGNETRGEIGEELVSLCHDIDPTKPVTSGHSGSEFMDVFGVNGGSEKQGFFSRERPDKPFIATEAPHTWQTRGYYRTQTWYRDGFPNKRQQPFELPNLTEKEIFHYEWAASAQWTNRKQHFNSSYDNAMVRISARKNWDLMRDLPWFSGHFRWTGFDYYGEAGYIHGGWPFRLFMGGALDVAGFKKDLFYFYKSQWTKAPMVHILPHWTHPSLEKGTKIPVWVYSNCDEVELFLNGRSLGKDKPGKQWDQMQCEWSVPYAPGELKAVGYINGKEVALTTQTTAQHPATLQNQLELSDENEPSDRVAILTTKLMDSKSTFYPYGENKVYYSVTGDAKIISLENGDPVDTTNNVGIYSKKAFMGATRAFLKLADRASNASVVTGAIIGEKQQLTSNLAHIDVQQTEILGTAKNVDFDIYYTLDGTTPTPQSLPYTNPIPVTLGSTVRAVVYANEVSLFTMEEAFAKNLGLHWGTGKALATTGGGMPAVDAEFTGAVAVTGAGENYLDFKGKEGSIIWYQENDGSAGSFKLSFSYASAATKPRPMELFINSKKVGVVDFTPTGKWHGAWKKTSVTVQLDAGANYIELRSFGESGPNVKTLRVE